MEKEEVIEKEQSDSGTQGQSKSQPKRLSTKRLVVNLVVKIVSIVVAVWLLFSFVLGITIHYGNNMHPAINDGDLVVSLRLQRPYLNAAVLYERNGKKCVGRVVGLPGNVIEINELGQLLVNGVAAAEDIYYPTYPNEQSAIEYPYTVEEGKVFILNDLREDTNDSRASGAVDMSDLDGPIIFSFRRRGF